jgi:exopolysaccharide biosynthesis polyprenyl glycosylphosphotransferase
MNIIGKNVLLPNILYRMLDIVVLIGITWLVSGKSSHAELMRLLTIYGSLLMLVIFSACGIYKSWRVAFVSNQFKRLLLAWCAVLVVFNIIILLLSNQEQLAILWPYCLFKSPEFNSWALYVYLGLAAYRLLVKLGLAVFRESGYNQRTAVIVGAGRSGRKLAQYLDENRWMGIRLVGFFDDGLPAGQATMDSPKRLAPVLGTVEKCSEFCLTGGINMVFIALPMSAEAKISKLMKNLGTRGVNIFLVPNFFIFGIQRAKIHQLGELHLMDFNLFPGWKRLFDIIFSIITIILTFPIWLIIIIIIKVENSGPIFYTDPRIGENGKRFGCLKFRTMQVDACEKLEALLESDPKLREEYKSTFKLKKDPRVTRFGRFLRVTSLDELPQFINILQGDMSVVGARPVLPNQFDDHYQEIALTYCAMKPGLTGPWQVGPRSDTSDYRERIELDSWYVLNNSISLDLKIISLTIWRILRPKGAY